MSDTYPTKDDKKRGLHCLRCDDNIFSRHRHDFVVCSCNNCFVDGGDEYFRYGVVHPDLVEEIEE